MSASLVARTTVSISMDDIKRINERNGFKWFEKSNMRFFGTSLPKTGLHDPNTGCIFFVSRERKPSVHFRVMCMNAVTGSMDGIDYQKYATRAQATARMKNLIVAEYNPWKDSTSKPWNNAYQD